MSIYLLTSVREFSRKLSDVLDRSDPYIAELLS